MTAPRAYYNDTDAAACAVLSEQIRRGVIPFGDVDNRSIKDVSPDDLRGYTQCHFFAGGGLWGVAARLAGWPDDRPLWTGSCPCQPYSVAGKGLGADDPRHLWPDFFRLIRSDRPPVVMGEQVAGAAGYGWLDGVRADLAGENYASRGVDIPALAVDAPHERNRLYWIAVGDAACVGRGEGRTEPSILGRRATAPRADALSCGLGHADGIGCAQAIREPGNHASAAGGRSAGRAQRPHGRNGSFWADAEWILCHDGKARRTKPGLPLLVDGFPGRVDCWRIGGNAISPVLAAEVIAAFMEAEAPQ